MQKAEPTSADHWTARRRGYFRITAHWFVVESGELVRRQACIALRRMIVTYAVIGRLMEFGTHTKILHCVTDC